MINGVYNGTISNDISSNALKDLEDSLTHYFENEPYEIPIPENYLYALENLEIMDADFKAEAIWKIKYLNVSETSNEEKVNFIEYYLDNSSLVTNYWQMGRLLSLAIGMNNMVLLESIRNKFFGE